MKLETRHLRLALLASLGGNLFLGGLLVGDWVRGPAIDAREPVAVSAEPRSGATAARGALQRLLAAVPAAERPEVERRLDTHRRELQRASQQLREARERVATAVGADNFDRAVLERAYAEQRERTAVVQATIQRAMMDAIGDLPPDTRRAIVAAVAGQGGVRR